MGKKKKKKKPVTRIEQTLAAFLIDWGFFSSKQILTSASWTFLPLHFMCKIFYCLKIKLRSDKKKHWSVFHGISTRAPLRTINDYCCRDSFNSTNIYSGPTIKCAQEGRPCSPDFKPRTSKRQAVQFLRGDSDPRVCCLLPADRPAFPAGLPILVNTINSLHRTVLGIMIMYPR